MTDIAEIFAPPVAANSTPKYAKSSDEDIMGKEDFLTLLVAQLQNQDPLNPDDATEFTSQLAEFSSLEQLQNLNESMESLASAQQQADKFATMGLMGQEVVYADSKFTFDGDPVKVGYQLDGTASSVTMTIQDEAGSTVATLHPTELKKGDHFLEWDGLDSEGNELPAGKYNIVLQASAAGDGNTIAVSPLVQSEVTGVDFSNSSGEAMIHTLAGAEISAGLIIAVYQPEQTHTKDITEEDEESSAFEDAIDGVVDDITEGVTRTSTPQQTNESAPTDEEQIEQDRLQHSMAG
ncbi:MAG TPA: flagellar hook assembly protein FlgD [Desulfobacterales bacterium]|nr:flagellar hook assembly protein FlgD [Desulfobacterales bacterium]